MFSINHMVTFKNQPECLTLLRPVRHICPAGHERAKG